MMATVLTIRLLDASFLRKLGSPGKQVLIRGPDRARQRLNHLDWRVQTSAYQYPFEICLMSTTKQGGQPIAYLVDWEISL